MSGDQTFASRSVPVHVGRGVLGLGLLLASFVLIPLTGAVSLLLVLPAIWVLRGCPSCWLLGLTQTRARVREESGQDAPPGARVP